MLPKPAEVLPKVLSKLASQGLNPGLLQLDGWWMNHTQFTPNLDFFPDWSSFRESIGNIALLLYKAYFSQKDRLFDQFPCRVQSNKGPFYPCAESSLGFFSKLFQEGSPDPDPSPDLSPSVNSRL